MCLVDNFINNKLMESALEDNSNKKYRQDLKRYFDYFSEKYNIDNELEILKNTKRIDIDEFRDYLLINKHYAVSTVNGVLITLRQFCNYLLDRNIIENNFMNNIKMVKYNYKNKDIKPKKEKEIITKEDFNKIIKMTLTEKGQRDFDFNGVRNCLATLILATSGMRVNELVGITMDRIVNKDGTLFIHFSKEDTKKDIEKSIPVVGVALEYYNKYIENRNNINLIDSDYLFVSKEGKRLHKEDINRFLDSCIKRGGIDKHITAHCFRKFFSAMCIKCDINELVCKVISGWSIGSDMMAYYAFKNINEDDNLKIESINKVLDFIIDRRYLKSVNF